MLISVGSVYPTVSLAAESTDNDSSYLEYVLG
jgi:hypothetical protein